MYQKRKIRAEEKNNDSQKSFHQSFLTGKWGVMKKYT